MTTEDDAIDDMLKNVPESVRPFVESLVEAIKNFALLYAHTPDDRALPHLEDYLRSIEPSVIEAVGADKATIIVDALHRAVMTRKHQIEAGGASRA